jgi:hypothetical protein
VAGGRTGAGEALSFFFDGAGDELRFGAMLVGKTPGPVFSQNASLSRRGVWTSVESQKFENRVRRKNHPSKNRLHLKRARETRFLQNAFLLYVYM